MYCPKCGTQISDNVAFCGTCGQAINQPAPANNSTNFQSPTSQANVNMAAQGTAQRTSGFAIASLVLGILGISILAIIFGAIAINQTGKDPNLSGRGMAIAGLVLGIVWVAIIFIFVIAIIGAASSL
jgi:uncharacterized membrane protein YvbJ